MSCVFSRFSDADNHKECIVSRLSWDTTVAWCLCLGLGARLDSQMKQQGQLSGFPRNTHYLGTIVSVILSFFPKLASQIHCMEISCLSIISIWRSKTNESTHAAQRLIHASQSPIAILEILFHANVTPHLMVIYHISLFFFCHIFCTPFKFL